MLRYVGFAGIGTTAHMFGTRRQDREQIGAIRCDSVLAYSSIGLEEKFGASIPSRLTDSKGAIQVQEEKRAKDYT